MVAMVEGLQTGAAQGVFDTVKAALDTAAHSAADAINANMKAIICTAAGTDNVTGLEAVGLLRTARLQGTAFSGHIGFHSNQQVICHLLHLVVQLALFPQGPLANFSQQAGCPFSALKPNETQAGPARHFEAAAQTDAEPVPPPPRSSGHCVGVRIGGGYHLFHAPPDEGSSCGTSQKASSGAGAGALSASSTRPQSPAGWARPLLEDMASETLRLSSADRMTPPETRREVPEDAGQYGYGARSDGTRCDRFRVAAYAPNAGDTATVVPEREIRKRRDGDGVQLARYLGRSANRADAPPQNTSRQRSRRPGSAHVAKTARPASASAEAGSSLGPATIAAVRRLREWASSDAEGPPPVSVLNVGRPFLAEW